ncbi:MAG TPA: hypothetical protein VD886_21220 [Herpetosiphonaceae bacterium]|nr:hypothetical protein [Herpetosiphonaceae bacterium]
MSDDEIVDAIDEAWLVTTSAGRDSNVLAILVSTLASKEMQRILDQLYRDRYLPPGEQRGPVDQAESLVGLAYLNDGTVWDQRVGNDTVTACRAYAVTIRRRNDHSCYVQWRGKGALREWDAEKQAFWTNEWWEDGLTLEIDPRHCMNERNADR